jgi:hypothetical protein
MKITVHLSPDVAEQLQRGSAETAAADELITAATELGVELRPMHPNAADAALRATFVVDVKDAALAGEVVSRLQALPATRAAYIKPAPEMP